MVTTALPPFRENLAYKATAHDSNPQAPWKFWPDVADWQRFLIELEPNGKSLRKTTLITGKFSTENRDDTIAFQATWSGDNHKTNGVIDYQTFCHARHMQNNPLAPHAWYIPAAANRRSFVSTQPCQ